MAKLPMAGMPRTPLSVGRYVSCVLAVVACFASSAYLWAAARAEVYRAQVQHVLDHDPSAVVICEASGHVKFANSRLSAYTGYTLDDLQTRGLSVIVPAELYEQHAAGFHSAANRGVPGMQPYRRILPVRCSDGKYILAVVTVSAINGVNQRPEFYAFIMPLPPTPELNQDNWPYDFKMPAWPGTRPVSEPAVRSVGEKVPAITEQRNAATIVIRHAAAASGD